MEHFEARGLDLLAACYSDPHWSGYKSRSTIRMAPHEYPALHVVSHGLVVLLSFVGFSLVGQLALRRSLGKVTLLSAIPTWLLLPLDPIVMGLCLGFGSFGYFIERGPSALPFFLPRTLIDFRAWHASDELTRVVFGLVWYRYSVPIFLAATWGFNLLYDYVWFWGMGATSLIVLAPASLAYGSTAGALFRSSE